MTEPSIQDIWAMVPSVDCDGRCATACRVIGMSEGEFIQMQDHADPDFPTFMEMMDEQRAVGDSYRCPNLSEDGLCGAYDVRPLVCRLYGVAESIACPYGCKPEGGYMTKDEASALWQLMSSVHGPTV